MEDGSIWINVGGIIATAITAIFGKSYWDSRAARASADKVVDEEKIQLQQRVNQLEFALGVLVAGLDNEFRDNPAMTEVVKKVKSTLDEQAGK